jgi:hypothetical protein
VPEEEPLGCPVLDVGVFVAMIFLAYSVYRATVVGTQYKQHETGRPFTVITAKIIIHVK